jgi:hypothetical protein
MLTGKLFFTGNKKDHVDDILYRLNFLLLCPFLWICCPSFVFYTLTILHKDLLLDLRKLVLDHLIIIFC